MALPEGTAVDGGAGCALRTEREARSIRNVNQGGLVHEQIDQGSRGLRKWLVICIHVCPF